MPKDVRQEMLMNEWGIPFSIIQEAIRNVNKEKELRSKTQLDYQRRKNNKWGLAGLLLCGANRRKLGAPSTSISCASRHSKTFALGLPEEKKRRRSQVSMSAVSAFRCCSVDTRSFLEQDLQDEMDACESRHSSKSRKWSSKYSNRSRKWSSKHSNRSSKWSSRHSNRSSKWSSSHSNRSNKLSFSRSSEPCDQSQDASAKHNKLLNDNSLQDTSYHSAEVIPISSEKSGDLVLGSNELDGVDGLDGLDLSYRSVKLFDFPSYGEQSPLRDSLSACSADPKNGTENAQSIGSCSEPLMSNELDALDDLDYSFRRVNLSGLSSFIQQENQLDTTNKASNVTSKSPIHHSTTTTQSPPNKKYIESTELDSLDVSNRRVKIPGISSIISDSLTKNEESPLPSSSSSLKLDELDISCRRTVKLPIFPPEKENESSSSVDQDTTTQMSSEITTDASPLLHDTQSLSSSCNTNSRQSTSIGEDLDLLDTLTNSRVQSAAIVKELNLLDISNKTIQLPITLSHGLQIEKTKKKRRSTISTTSQRTDNESPFDVEEAKGLSNLDYTRQQSKLSEIDQASSTMIQSNMDITNHSIKSIDIVLSAK